VTVKQRCSKGKASAYCDLTNGMVGIDRQWSATAIRASSIRLVIGLHINLDVTRSCKLQKLIIAIQASKSPCRGP
jgi:hypothetical protein